MFRFFTPTTKVQKDRAIMRETDARLAKYSRRGLIFNFLAFLLCLVGGNFVEKQQGLAIVLTVGLLLFTLLRGFFLFRFETLYPRAPAKWRNSYFLATLLGAAWWGFILVSITLVLRMEDEAPLLWLYTVVFFSTTAHAFAPYQRFLTVYQFMGQVPAALAAFFIPDVNAWLYAIVLLVFYLMLVHQCRLMSEDYWQKLAATYALAKKTENLEEEKRGTRAVAQLNQEFMNNLHTDLSQVVQLTEIGMHQMRAGGNDDQPVERLRHAQDFQAKIFASVDDFRNLLAKELTLDIRVFNVRHEMQALVGQAVDDAERRNIHIESALSPTIPMRLEGDAVRFAQIVRTVLSSIVERANNSFVLVEADFLREFETSGDLQVTVSRHDFGRKRLFQAEAEEGILNSLDLSVCKGLADSMDGNLAVVEEANEGFQIRFRAKFTVPERDSQVDFHKDILEGHSVLLVHPNAALIEVKRRELDALGLKVRTESQFRRAYQTLVNSYRENAPIESVLFYLSGETGEALEFSRSLADHKELRNTHQLIACTRTKGRFPEIQELVEGPNSVHLVPQPTGLYELGMTLYTIYKAKQLADSGHWDEEAPSEEVQVLLVNNDEGRTEDLIGALEGAGATVKVVNASEVTAEVLHQGSKKLVVMQCSDGKSRCPETVAHIRALEKQSGANTLIPLIGMGWGSVTTYYEQGFDHFIDLNQEPVTVATTLHYWANL